MMRPFLVGIGSLLFLGACQTVDDIEITDREAIQVQFEARFPLDSTNLEEMEFNETAWFLDLEATRQTGTPDLDVEPGDLIRLDRESFAGPQDLRGNYELDHFTAYASLFMKPNPFLRFDFGMGLGVERLDAEISGEFSRESEVFHLIGPAFKLDAFGEIAPGFGPLVGGRFGVGFGQERFSVRSQLLVGGYLEPMESLRLRAGWTWGNYRLEGDDGSFSSGARSDILLTTSGPMVSLRWLF